MILVSIAGSIVLICLMLALPLFAKVPREARLAGILAGVTWLILSLLLNGAPLGIVGQVSMGMSAGLAVRFALTAWREFGDRRMVERAEAYQARIDAERGAA